MRIVKWNAPDRNLKISFQLILIVIFLFILIHFFHVTISSIGAPTVGGSKSGKIADGNPERNRNDVASQLRHLCLIPKGIELWASYLNMRQF